ncbi:MAG TPA: type 1 glutamine amidotransferase domain-containing protein [Chitinophagaceae bacterium]
MTQLKVLFVATSNDRIGDSIYQTGAWLEEIAAPYYIFKDANATVTIASPKGGEVPMDPRSLSIMVATSYTKRFLKDESAMQFAAHSKPLAEINAADFDIVYVPGGHGPLWDLADNKILKSLLETYNRLHKPVGLVCHGVAALLSLQNDSGEPLVKGKRVTGFSNSEEKSGSYAELVPFLLETELTLLGGLYSRNENYVSYVVADGNIITGQNSASSEAVAKKLLMVLEDRKYGITLEPVNNN